MTEREVQTSGDRDRVSQCSNSGSRKAEETDVRNFGDESTSPASRAQDLFSAEAVSGWSQGANQSEKFGSLIKQGGDFGLPASGVLEIPEMNWKGPPKDNVIDAGMFQVEQAQPESQQVVQDAMREADKAPMSDASDQQTRKEIDAAILNGDLNSLEKILSKYKGREKELDQVMERVAKDMESKGVSVQYRPYASLSYDGGGDDLRTGQFPAMNQRELVINKSGWEPAGSVEVQNQIVLRPGGMARHRVDVNEPPANTPAEAEVRLRRAFGGRDERVPNQGTASDVMRRIAASVRRKQ